MNRIRSLITICAAWNYHMAKENSVCANATLGIKEAGQLSELASFVFGEQVPCTEFLKGENYYCDEALKYWDAYKNLSNYVIIFDSKHNIVPNEIKDKFLKSFSEWCHNTFEGIDLKMYGTHFIYIFELIIMVGDGQINKRQAEEMFDNVMDGVPFLKIKKFRLMRIFVRLSRKQDDILKKIFKREKNIDYL
jgi:hypothetical protein